MKNKNFGRKRQAIYILSNRKSTRIIKTLMDFFFFIKVKIKMVCFSVPSPDGQGDHKGCDREGKRNCRKCIFIDISHEHAVNKVVGILQKHGAHRRKGHLQYQLFDGKITHLVFICHKKLLFV